MNHQDNRTPAQRKTHYLAIVAADKGMSGWGLAKGGKSRCAWAFNPSEVSHHKALSWVKDSLPSLRYVNLVDLRTYRAPKGTAHFQVYVITPNHPAFSSVKL